MQTANPYLPVLMSLAFLGCETKSTVSPDPSQLEASAPPPLLEFVDLELFSRRIDGQGDASKLNGRVGQGVDVELFAVSPDAQRAVYVLGGEGRSGELYSCRLDGGDAPTHLNPQSRIHDSFTISPDSQRVLWMGRDDMLYSGSIDGSAQPIKLDGPCHRAFYWISSDSQWVVYHRAGSLFSQALDGTTEPQRLAGPHRGPYRRVDRFQVSPNNKWVVFRQDVETEQGRGSAFYSRPIDGLGEPIKLTHALDVSSSEIVISADSQRVVFRAGPSSDTFSLYSVPIDGGSPVALNNPTESIDGGTAAGCKVSADSRFAVYQAGDRYALYSRPMDGKGAPVLLTPSSYIRYFALGPNGKRVVYLARRDADPTTPVDLCSRLIDGSDAEIRLNGLLPQGAFVWVEFHITPDGKRVVFRAKASPHTTDYALFSCPIDSGEQLVKLSDPSKTWGDVRHFEMTADGRQVLYLGKPRGDTEYHVYSRPIDGSGKPIRLSQRPNEGSGVSHFAIAPDGKRLLYVGYRGTKQLRARRAVGGGGASYGGIHVPFRESRRWTSSL